MAIVPMIDDRPMASGNRAATKLPKTQVRAITINGMASVSASLRSAAMSSLTYV